MDSLSQATQTFATTKAITGAGTTTTITTGAATTFCVKGKAFSRAAATNLATPTVDATTGLAFVPIPIGYGSVFVLAWDQTATPVLKVAQGQVVQLDSNYAWNLLPQWPETLDIYCPFAVVSVLVGSTGAAWTFGTSNLAGPPTGVTITFTDLLMQPPRPFV